MRPIWIKYSISSNTTVTPKDQRTLGAVTMDSCVQPAVLHTSVSIMATEHAINLPDYD